MRVAIGTISVSAFCACCAGTIKGLACCITDINACDSVLRINFKARGCDPGNVYITTAACPTCSGGWELDSDESTGWIDFGDIGGSVKASVFKVTTCMNCDIVDVIAILR